MMSHGTPLHKVSFALVFIGAINWGLIGLFNWNLVNVLFGGVPMMERIIYILVGLAALVLVSGSKNCCKK